MEYIVIVFRSRLQTVKFSGILSRYGIYNEIINTPKEANIGCGLSVKIFKASYLAAKKLLNVSSNLGGYTVFNVKIVLGKYYVKRI